MATDNEWVKLKAAAVMDKRQVGLKEVATDMQLVGLRAVATDMQLVGLKATAVDT